LGKPLTVGLHGAMLAIASLPEADEIL